MVHNEIRYRIYFEGTDAEAEQMNAVEVYNRYPGICLRAELGCGGAKDAIRFRTFFVKTLRSILFVHMIM